MVSLCQQNIQIYKVQSGIEPTWARHEAIWTVQSSSWDRRGRGIRVWPGHDRGKTWACVSLPGSAKHKTIHITLFISCYHAQFWPAEAAIYIHKWIKTHPNSTLFNSCRDQLILEASDWSLVLLHCASSDCDLAMSHCLQSVPHSDCCMQPASSILGLSRLPPSSWKW